MTMPKTSDDAPVGEAAALAVAACLFHGFSDPSRLAILRHLTLGEHRVVDLTGHLGLAQSTVSKHLACLRDCGLVVSRPRGRAAGFTLTGDAVALCPVYGVNGSSVAAHAAAKESVR
jgi:biotin operon repressor